MNLRQIEAFRAVMLAGTVTGAAEMLHISQPAVSRLIVDLECVSALPLFVRKKKRLTPTPEAKIFFAEVQHAFAGVEHLKKKAQDIRNFNSGHLRIAASPAMSMGFLRTVLEEFLTSHEGVTATLQTHVSTIVKDSVASQLNDIGLVFGDANEPALRSEVFVRANAVCILPPGHRLADKDIIEPQDLADEDFVSLSANDTTRLRIDQAFQQAGVDRVIRLEAQLATVVCGFVLDGFGVSIVNPFTAFEYRERGLLLKAFRPEIPVRFQLVRPAQQTQSTLADGFVETLHRYCGECLKTFQELGLMT
ncbi:LysR family transcriptional regulator [Mesorhizobium sp. M00.F.Ca.ET.038.03.1.1]|nr:LysR family transcriptional regulator [Mesorhizobium sp. M00.F.Ca.ET.038.03.1.1]